MDPWIEFMAQEEAWELFLQEPPPLTSDRYQEVCSTGPDRCIDLEDWF